MKKTLVPLKFHACCLLLIFIFAESASLGQIAQSARNLAKTRETSQQLNAAQSDVLKVAREAFELFAQGVESGNFELFLKTVSEDATARLPVAKFRQAQKGKQEISEYLRFVGQELKVRARVTVTNIAVFKNGVAFEFGVNGVAAGGATNTQNVIFFEVRNNKITAFREYFGN